MRRTVALLLLAVACKGESPKSAPAVVALAGDLVIANVTIAPMDRDTTIANRSVVIRGDKIVAIAPAVDATAAKVIDGKGKWLMPGLADMHVHTWSEHDLTMFVVAGVTTVRNMYGGEQHLGWRKEIAAGTRFGPTLVTASPIVDGDPPVWPGSVVLTKPEEVDGKVAALKGEGYDFLKPYARLEKPVYDALVAAGKKHGMTVQGHVPRAVGLPHAIASGQKSVEHLDGWIEALSTKEPEPGGSYWKTIGARVAVADTARIAGLANDMKKAGAYNCATLVVMERFAHLDDVATLEKRIAWLELVPTSVRAMWNPKADFRTANATPEDYAAMRAANTLREAIVKTLASSGAPLIVGTDAGNPYVVPGASLRDEIELLVKAGARRARVMRAATADAGTFLGAPGTAGVVAVGARADLLLVPVDPMTTPIPLVPNGIVLRGAWLSKQELEAKLEAIKQPPPVDRFEDVPPLAPEGKAAVQAHYEIRSGANVIGEERVAVGTVDSKRVIVAQVINDVPARIASLYRIAGTTTRLEQKSPFGTIVVDANAVGGKLVAKGTALDKPLALEAPLPKDAFLSGPGMGGMVELAARFTGMKVGDVRQATSLEVATFPRPTLERVAYEIKRGEKTYSVTMKYEAMTIAAEFVVDDPVFPRELTLGPPLDWKIVRVK